MDYFSSSPQVCSRTLPHFVFFDPQNPARFMPRTYACAASLSSSALVHAKLSPESASFSQLLPLALARNSMLNTRCTLAILL